MVVPETPSRSGRVPEVPPARPTSLSGASSQHVTTRAQAPAGVFFQSQETIAACTATPSPSSSTSAPLPAAASNCSLGALLPGIVKPVLRWTGCWGTWDQDAVSILAPCLALFQIARRPEVRLHDISSDLCLQLSTMLPEGCNGLEVRDLGNVGHQHRLQAALICPRDRCDSLQREWQGRPLCGGHASATWLHTDDTASQSHVACVQAVWDYNANPDAIALEIPRRWAFRALPEVGNHAALSSESHWHRFATIFGEVVGVDLIWSSRCDPIVRLLAHFQESSSARLMYEMLTGRYLYNPLTANSFDAHAVVCVPGSSAELRARLFPTTEPTSVDASASRAAVAEQPHPQPGAPSIGSVFKLLRVELDGRPRMPTSEVSVTPQRPVAMLGREETCDLVVPSTHVSRHHAIVRLCFQSQSHLPPTLVIQDKSVNGTWVNGRRIGVGELTGIDDGDRVSFVSKEDPDVPVYLVRRLQDGSSALALAPPEEVDTCRVPDTRSSPGIQAQALRPPTGGKDGADRVGDRYRPY